MTHKLAAAPVLTKLSEELEQIQQTLQLYAGHPVDRAPAIQREGWELQSKSPRVRVGALERYILRSACEEGEKYLAALADEAALEYERALLAYAQLMEVPPSCREPFRLRVCERMSYSEIASRLGIRVETVKQRVARAMEGIARMQKRLKGEGVVE